MPASTGGNTSPLLSARIVSSEGSAAQSIASGTAEIHQEIMPRSLSASRPRSESGGAVPDPGDVVPLVPLAAGVDRGSGG
jgi:hypothetical protein